MINRIVYAIATIATLFALEACSSKSETKSEAEAAEELPKVEVRKVNIEDVPQIAEYTATVEAFKTNNISSSTPNRIKSILVDVGSHVKAGQRVVLLDNVNIDQLKVRLENAQREYDRALNLLNIGSGTRQQVDQLKTELDAQQRQYSNMVENTILVSPIAGVVTERNYDPGDMTGTLPILTIEQVQPVKVIVNISETHFTQIHQGMKVEVKTDVYGDETFTGKVYLIHPKIDSATRTFTVEVTIENKDGKIHPGMFARVFFDYGSQPHVVVPDRAIVKQTGSSNMYVYVYNPSTGTVSYNRVELGRRLDSYYEVLSGVDDGADVVITGQTRLADGVKVELVKPAETK